MAHERRRNSKSIRLSELSSLKSKRSNRNRAFSSNLLSAKMIKPEKSSKALIKLEVIEIKIWVPVIICIPYLEHSFIAAENLFILCEINTESITNTFERTMVFSKFRDGIVEKWV